MRQRRGGTPVGVSRRGEVQTTGTRLLAQPPALRRPGAAERVEQRGVRDELRPRTSESEGGGCTTQRTRLQVQCAEQQRLCRLAHGRARIAQRLQAEGRQTLSRSLEGGGRSEHVRLECKQKAFRSLLSVRAQRAPRLAQSGRALPPVSAMSDSARPKAVAASASLSSGVDSWSATSRHASCSVDEEAAHNSYGGCAPPRPRAPSTRSPSRDARRGRPFSLSLGRQDDTRAAFLSRSVRALLKALSTGRRRRQWRQKRGGRGDQTAES